MFPVFYGKFNNKVVFDKMVSFFKERQNFSTKHTKAYLRVFGLLLKTDTINMKKCKDIFKQFREQVGNRDKFMDELVVHIENLYNTQLQIVNLNKVVEDNKDDAKEYAKKCNRTAIQHALEKRKLKDEILKSQDILKEKEKLIESQEKRYIEMKQQFELQLKTYEQSLKDKDLIISLMHKTTIQ